MTTNKHRAWLFATSALVIAACASPTQTAQHEPQQPQQVARNEQKPDPRAIPTTALQSVDVLKDGAAPRDGADKVTITGSLIATSPENAPKSVQVITSQELRERGAPSVSEFVQSLGRAAPAPMANGQYVAGVQSGTLPAGAIDTEKYEHKELNRIKLVAEEPVSTFSIDVDTAAYANVRRMLNQGYLPPKDSVRVEELVNYFDYGYARPKSKAEPFATEVQIAPSPWGKGRELMRVAVQGYDMNREARPPLNLTLLMDVSGSMSDPDKLPLAKRALGMLIDELGKDDHVSIVVYAGAAGAVLEPTSGADKSKIMAALDRLNAGGSTAGGEGLRLAYTLAKQNFDKKSVNRVMLMTDGDFNVGINDPNQLKGFIERERDAGIYLSVLGFGQGNYNDALMQKLAQNGNGIAAYVDTINEARKVLKDDFAGSMFTIADDVKIQVEFNPAKVAEYRLIGYETRMLNREDFNNDKVDAGDIGAGASVTAIYEITPVGSSARLVDESRYANAPKLASTAKADEFGYLKLRYKAPGEKTSKLIERPISSRDEVASIEKASESMRFATAVAGYGELLRQTPHIDASFSWDSVIALANSAKGEDAFGYRAEFVQLARAAKTAQSQKGLPARGGVGQ